LPNAALSADDDELLKAESETMAIGRPENESQAAAAGAEAAVEVPSCGPSSPDDVALVTIVVEENTVAASDERSAETPGRGIPLGMKPEDFAKEPGQGIPMRLLPGEMLPDLPIDDDFARAIAVAEAGASAKPTSANREADSPQPEGPLGRRRRRRRSLETVAVSFQAGRSAYSAHWLVDGPIPKVLTQVVGSEV
jgi:hypothetical protein